MKGSEMACACTIAGSDSGGGAGIQADLKTFAAFDVWGVSVITVVTAQNPQTLRNSWTLPSEAVSAQMDAVFPHFPIRICKTGMLVNTSIIETVAKRLPPSMPLVVDPVIKASSGATLLSHDALESLIKNLFPKALVVTPNVPEAEILSGTGPIRTIDEMCSAGELIRGMGAKCVVVKGGHVTTSMKYVTDVLIDEEGQWLLEGPRYQYRVHGGGCIFSAALTACIANGTNVRDAAHTAKTFTLSAFRNAFLSAGGMRSANP